MFVSDILGALSNFFCTQFTLAVKAVIPFQLLLSLSNRKSIVNVSYVQLLSCFDISCRMKRSLSCSHIIFQVILKLVISSDAIQTSENPSTGLKTFRLCEITRDEVRPSYNCHKSKCNIYIRLQWALHHIYVPCTNSQVRIVTLCSVRWLYDWPFLRGSPGLTTMT